MKAKIITISAVVILSGALLGPLWLQVTAQTVLETTFCGDGLVQSPNDAGVFEKCDDGDGLNPRASARCSAECDANLLGWAWADTFGWLDLSCQNFLSWPCTLGFGLQLSAGDVVNRGSVRGWAWSDRAGWVCFGETCQGYGTPPNGGPLKTELLFDQEDPQVIGWAKIIALGDDGWVSLTCRNNTDECGRSDYQVRVFEKNFGDIEKPNTRLALRGFAWNDRAGWLWFDPQISRLSPWLQTKYGDIYARRGIAGAAPPPAGAYNATYRIISGGTIEQFLSAKQVENPSFWVQESFFGLQFPIAKTGYQNALGKIDLNGMICDFAGQPTCQNRYGKTVVDLSHPANEITVDNIVLGGRIYYAAGDLTIDQPLTFNNASSFDSGAGTVIVNGNLTVTADSFYQSQSPPIGFINLASVAWIVRGDLRIAPSVENLAGNFIVLGDGQECSAESGQRVFGCGQIETCYNPNPLVNVNCDLRLRSYGLMMARKFFLERTFTENQASAFESLLEGSEVITYDGRLMANIPPGLEDFIKGLPSWSPR